MQSSMAFSGVRKAVILRLEGDNQERKLMYQLAHPVYQATSTFIGLKQQTSFLAILWVSWAFLVWPARLALIGVR